MQDLENKKVKYTIWNPTGNITALVESSQDAELWRETAAGIMERHSDVEQVGFVRFTDDPETPVFLRMAGGEFCGNASMSAAALYLLRKGRKGGTVMQPETVRLNVSGTDTPVRVDLSQTSENTFSASIELPGYVRIEDRSLTCGTVCGKLTCVKMKGIVHYIIGLESPFYYLKNRKEDAEKALKNWCQEDDPCVGLMFLDQSKEQAGLTPLVYVPASRTIFWENSCASGSAAVGMYLAAKYGRPSDICLNEPGGMLRVMSDPDGKTVLHGSTALTGSFVYSD